MWTLVLPMVVAVGAAFGAAPVERRLRPDWATWTLTCLSGGSALAVAWALATLGMSFALDQPLFADLFGWCSAVFSTHDRVAAPIGIAAWIALGGMAWGSLLRVLHRRRAASLPADDVLDSREPLAFAVPGRPGRIVVSTAMLASLDLDEQRVLYAHERSHLRRRHHRFLDVAEASAAAVPFLRPLSSQVRFATERWADEDAADVVGDRRLVARAIARAALATADAPSTSLAFNGSGARARVEAMVRPTQRPATTTGALATAGVAGIAVSLGGSGIQLHHLVEFVAHICGA